MRSSALLLIAALAGSGFCQSYTTLKDLLDTFPSCGRSCGAIAFKSIADGCGGEGAKIECICNGPADVTYGEVDADSEKGGVCAAQKCDDSDALSLANDILDFAKYCLENFNGTASNPSTPSSKVFPIPQAWMGPSSLTLKTCTLQLQTRLQPPNHPRAQNQAHLRARINWLLRLLRWVSWDLGLLWRSDVFRSCCPVPSIWVVLCFLCLSSSDLVGEPREAVWQSTGAGVTIGAMNWSKCTNRRR